MSTINIPGDNKKKNDKALKTKKSDPKPKKLTSGEALLNSMTAKKATLQKLKENATPSLHMTFDEEGNLAETLKTQPSLKKIKTEKSNSNNKKRASSSSTEPEKNKKAKDNNGDANTKNQPAKKMKKKKEKEAKEQTATTDKKKQDSLQYLETFISNRPQWKFGKLQQSWLLQHIYDTDAISTENFEKLLVYIKDVKGLAREKTLKEAETICQETKGTVQQLSYASVVPANGTSNNDNNDYDDFDAEKLLASMNAPAPQQSTPAPVNNNDNNVKLERAKEIVRTLI